MEETNIPHIGIIQTDEEIKINIPICCREGHDDCPHVVKQAKPKKRNIGL